MRARLLGASAMSLLALGAACSSSDDPNVHLAPSLVFPKGLLDTVNSVTVKVYDATTGVDCDATKGTVKGTPGAPLATKDLGTSGCAPGAKFCGDVQLEKSSDGRVFAADAYTAGNTTPVASGCTKATVDQDTLSVQITMLRFVPPSLCGGKASPVPVQCTDPGTVDDVVCGTDCLSKEILLSKGDLSTTGDTKQKAKPAFLWPAAKADAGRFLGFWGDRSPAAGRTQVAMRVMADDLHPYTNQGPGVETASFFLPNDPLNGFPPPGEAGSQFNPTATTANSAVYVAFEDNQDGSVAINLRSLDQTLVRSDQPTAKPIHISDATATAQTNPSMALGGSGAKLFIAWENGASVVGRSVATSGFAKDPQTTLGVGKSPVVVGTSTGWLVAYQGGSDIKLLPIDANGTPGAEIKVNDGSHTGNQEHPGVAVLSDGKIAVVWNDTGAQGGAGVFVQRFSSDLKPVANDQAVRINDVTLGAQASPAIAAGSNFFVAAWVDTASGHVRARLLDGTTGFLFNSVNGQSSDFQASLEDGHTRTSPAVVVGGAGPYIAIGWEDDTGSPSTFAGVFGRRFPVP